MDTYVKRKKMSQVSSYMYAVAPYHYDVHLCFDITQGYISKYTYDGLIPKWKISSQRNYFYN